jgi:hypothetical protein
MKRSYQLGTILWVEDQWEILESWAYNISRSDSISQAISQGKRLSIKTNETLTRLSEIEAERTIEQIIVETKDQPTFLNLRTGQLARAYLERITPGAILLDSDFPGGGYMEVVRCLREQEMTNYPLISWTQRDISELRPEIIELLGNPPRYIWKTGTKTEELVEHLLFSRRYLEQTLPKP